MIWFINGSEELSVRARKSIEEPGISNFVSIASLWEMAIKVSMGKLILEKPFSEVSRQILNNGFQILPVAFEDTLLLSDMPFHHKDPFDRNIIAQAITNGLTLISKDKEFKKYPLTTLW